MRLKSKFLSVVYSVVLFMLICSTVVVHILLNRQYREVTQDNITISSNIIIDDMPRLMAKQANDSDNMVRSTKMGEKIKFIHDSSGPDQFGRTKNSYQQIIAAVGNVSQASAGLHEVNSKVIQRTIAVDQVARNLNPVLTRRLLRC